MKFSNSLVIGYDKSEKDTSVLTIGKMMDGTIQVVRVLLDDEADRLYEAIAGSPISN